MRGSAKEIVEGMEIVLRLFPNAQGVIAIEQNKPEAIAAMEKAVKGHSRIRVLSLRTKYPQGGERSLIRVIAGIEYPITKLPADVGCIVDNVGTIYAIGRAVIYREPLFRHVMTVTGEAIKEPSNFIARDGTSFAELIEAAGGIKDGVTVKKIISVRRSDDGHCGRFDRHPDHQDDQRHYGACRGRRGACRKEDDGMPALRTLHHGLPERADAPDDGGRGRGRRL